MSNMEKYLKELEEKLKEEGIVNTDEILEKYRKRYSFSLEADISDEEIVDMLGTPEEVASKYSKNEHKSHNFEETEAKYKTGYNLIVKTIGDDIVVKQSNDDKNHVLFEGTNPDDYEIITDTEKGISVIYKKTKYLSLNRRRSGEITISIPKEKVFDRIELSNVSADFNIIDIKGRTVSLKITSGDADIHSVEAEEVTVNTVSGDFDIYKIDAKNVCLNTVSGDIEVEYIKASTTRIDSVSGDVDVSHLEGDFKSNSLSGDVKVNGEECGKLTKKIKGVFK